MREHSPPSERGVPPGGRWLVDCECGAEGKGGGGSTAGGCRCRLLRGPSAERLFRLLAVESRDWRDGRLQYSPRRGPCRLSFAMHPPSIHGRAPPPLGGGRGLSPFLLLAFLGFQRWFHCNPRRTKLFRKFLPEWQERYMGRVGGESVRRPAEPLRASVKALWALEKRSRRDCRKMGGGRRCEAVADGRGNRDALARRGHRDGRSAGVQRGFADDGAGLCPASGPTGAG